MSGADAMDAILTEARTAPVEALPGLIGQLAMAQATAMARLTTPASVISPPMPDELISITAAAVRLGVSRNFLYRKASILPFSRRMGRKLVFSTNGIEAYIKKAR